MKGIALVGLIIVLLLYCGSLALTQVDSDRTRAEEHGLALVGAKIYPSPVDDFITDGVVLIKDGKIVDVGKQGKIRIPAHFEKINASGMTLTAGFWNCHVHFAENKWQSAATIPAAELTQQLRDMLTRYGFTAIFDTGSVFENTRKIRQRIESGEIPGPRIMSAGEILYPKGGLPPSMLVIATGMMPGAAVTELENPEQAVQVVDQKLSDGVDAIKIYAATWGFTTSGQPAAMPLEVVRAVAAEAHKSGKLLLAHPSNSDGLNLAVDGGADVILHTAPASGNWSQAFVSKMKGKGISLVPTLKLPSKKGPHPAVVRIHGAGPADRLNSADEFYAYHGIAFLSYDKRGVGNSTGDWREAGVEDLAGDALAGVQALKSRKDINPKQIGLGGGSEGGWVASAVAARDKDVAFILLVAGPVLSFADELANETEDSLRAFGFSGDDLQAAIAFRKMINEMLRSGEALTDAGWEKTQAAAQKVKDEKWFPYVRPAATRDWRQKKQFLMLRFDPQPLWEQTTIPVLALYGELDRNVPAPKNVAALDKALKKAANRDYTIVVFPKANHEGMEAVKGFLDNEETARLSRFVPDYFDTAINWILKRVVVPK